MYAYINSSFYLHVLDVRKTRPHFRLKWITRSIYRKWSLSQVEIKIGKKRKMQ